MDKHMYFGVMIKGIEVFNKIKCQVVKDKLGEILVDLQKQFEADYFQNQTNTCIGDSIIEITREELTKVGL